MNIGVCVSFQNSVFLIFLIYTWEWSFIIFECIPKTIYGASIFNFLRKHLTVSTVVVPVYIPDNYVGGFPF